MWLLLAILMAPLEKTSTPADQYVVTEVDLARYSGRWYEIARLPNSFEKNLKCITATYSVRPDGRIKVVNQGIRIDRDEKISSVNGVAYVPNKNVPGKLKVTFFWPFYGDYWIIGLDKEYRYAMVGGPSKQFFWILSREKSMDHDILKSLIYKAKELGYDTSRLIMVDQSCEFKGSI